MTEQCSFTVYTGDTFRGHQCGHKGKVERDGKWYCGIHDPVAVAKRDKEREDKWQRHRNEQEVRWNRQEVRRQASRDLIEAAKEFCARVEKGEIYSKKTYAKFKEILGRLGET